MAVKICGTSSSSSGLFFRSTQAFSSSSSSQSSISSLVLQSASTSSPATFASSGLESNRSLCSIASCKLFCTLALRNTTSCSSRRKLSWLEEERFSSKEFGPGCHRCKPSTPGCLPHRWRQTTTSSSQQENGCCLEELQHIIRVPCTVKCHDGIWEMHSRGLRILHRFSRRRTAVGICSSSLETHKPSTTDVQCPIQGFKEYGWNSGEAAASLLSKTRSDVGCTLRTSCQKLQMTCYFQKPKNAQLAPAPVITSARPRRMVEQDELPNRYIQRQCVPESRVTPPKRDTGIASEKEWGIDLNNESINESGVNKDGTSWYRESGQDLGENGYRCRWTVMGGRSADGSTEWKEAWWEKSDWTGYKELGAEKSGKNAQGDTWWETWQEVLRQDELSNLAWIEKSAQKQATSGNGTAGWYEKWWEKYNAKGWSEKGAHKYGKLDDQDWWERWGEQYDGRGAVLKWTDKWAETDTGAKWGDKWEERFDHGVGTRQGETWNNNTEGWSRTWGEEHYGNGKVHKYGKSTSGESWDSIVEEATYYQAEPHYGWADAVGNSAQLLAIQTLERPPGSFPNIIGGTDQ
ncbi:hypothetical protein CY35_10G057400 [Sphagnum magellanicum]|nr:hypothetical protein CY35_10G057400 [Sphagnum magellanicum]